MWRGPVSPDSASSRAEISGLQRRSRRAWRGGEHTRRLHRVSAVVVLLSKQPESTVEEVQPQHRRRCRRFGLQRVERPRQRVDLIVLGAVREVAQLLQERAVPGGAGGFVLPFRPEGFAGRAAERIVGLGQGGQAQDAPAILGGCLQQAAEVVLVPARHHQRHAAVGLQAGGDVRLIPVPDEIALALAVRDGVGLHGVVDDNQVGAPADDGPAHADREILAAGRRGPVVRRSVAGFDREPELVRVFVHQIPRPPPEGPREAQGVGGADDGGARVAQEPPDREQERGIGRLGRTRRHQDHQPVEVAGGQFFQFGDEVEVVGGRPITGVLKRCLRPGAERAAEMGGGVLVFDGVREGLGWGDRLRVRGFPGWRDRHRIVIPAHAGTHVFA